MSGLRSTYGYSRPLLSDAKSENFLPQLKTKERHKEVYEPQDFYYPIKYEPKNNNLASVSLRSKTVRFPNIKPSPHEFDLEPYKEYSEHRVLNRPWLQQIQATLGDVFINDNTNDGIINTSEIMDSLRNKSKRFSQDNKTPVMGSVYNKNITNNEASSSQENNNDNSNEIPSKNPYSECFFIKEPYRIITNEEDMPNEDKDEEDDDIQKDLH